MKSFISYGWNLEIVSYEIKGCEEFPMILIGTGRLPSSEM
jgi:hypothetical protein